jgi:hypothetical protein
LEKYGGPPDSFFSLGVEQFNRNLDAMRGEYKDEEPRGELTFSLFLGQSYCFCYLFFLATVLWPIYHYLKTASVETRPEVCTKNAKATYFEHNGSVGSREETSFSNATTSFNNSSPIQCSLLPVRLHF